MYWIYGWMAASGGYSIYSSYTTSSTKGNCTYCYQIITGRYWFDVPALAIGVVSVLVGVVGLLVTARRRRAASKAAAS